jgi:hypothetical protein
MDFRSRHDNVTVADTGVPMGGLVDAAATGVKDLAAAIRNKAKAKKAQKISDAGGYFTLTPFQKSLIDVPAYAVSAGTTAQDAKDSPAMDISGGQLKKYLPYIIGVVILVIIFFIVKRKS